MPSTGERGNRTEVSYQLAELAEKFISEQLAAGRSPRTLHVYKRILRDLRSFLFEKLQKEDVRLITKDLMKLYAERIFTYTFGAEEKRAWIARVSIFFRWLNVTAVILYDPAATIKTGPAKKRRYPVYLTREEIARLLDCVPIGTPEGLRDRAILELLYSSGLRSGEICRLQLGEINFADGVARILMSKGKKDRMVPVGKAALKWIDEYVREVHGLRLSGPLFYDPNTRNPIAGWHLRRIVSKYKTLARIKKPCNPRSFRHSFAIHLLENGASIRHIQAMMGHASLKTTQKYTRIVPEELKRAHHRAHPSEKQQRKLPEVDPIGFSDRKNKVPY